MNFLKVLFIVILTILFLIFVAQHAYYVKLNFLGITYEVPLFVLVLVSFAVGFLLPALYFLVKDIRQTAFTRSITRGISYLARGYPQKAEGELSKVSRRNEEVALILLKAIAERGEIYRGEEVDIKRDAGFVDAFLGLKLLRYRDYEKAKGYLLSALSKDSSNLLALKGLRDISFLEKDLEACIKHQESVLKLCEKWEKETQKRILSDILSYASENLPEQRKDLLEKALDLHRSFYSQAMWIKHMLEKEDVKEAKKQIEKAFTMGVHNQVLAVLSQNEEHLTKIMDIIKEKEELINPDVLARIYIKLHLFTQLRPVMEKLSQPIKLMATAFESHREMDRGCGEMLQELYKPWVCSCGESYNNYLPMCEKCLTWGNITLRGIEDATGHK